MRSLLGTLRRFAGTDIGQAGDGRERAALAHVLSSTTAGDLDAVIAAMDDFATTTRFLINVGPEKGAILDAAVARARPRRLLELGTYCGYSALRIVRSMPAGAHLWTVERSRANAAIARLMWRHAGVADQVTCVRGWLGDKGETLRRLTGTHRFGAGSLDFVFIDHAKDQYLPDLHRIINRGWFHAGSVAVADNIKTPGAPEYYAYMREQQGVSWHTIEHHTHLEYRTDIPDLVLESQYLR